MFVDASAMLAILLGEAEGPRMAAAIDAAPPETRITNVIAVWEAVVALHRRKNLPVDTAERALADFLGLAGVETLSVSAEDLSLAARAFEPMGVIACPRPSGAGRWTSPIVSITPRRNEMERPCCLWTRGSR